MAQYEYRALIVFILCRKMLSWLFIDFPVRLPIYPGITADIDKTFFKSSYSFHLFGYLIGNSRFGIDKQVINDI